MNNEQVNILVRINAWLALPTGQNVVVFALLTVFAWWLWSVSKKEYWCSAWRQVRKNKLAMVALAVLLLYMLIALLDSITWRDPLRNEQGEIVMQDDGNAPILEARPYSLLDRIDRAFTRFGRYPGFEDAQEVSYSTPFAEQSLIFTTMLDNDGNATRIREYLERPKADVWPRYHILGTDKGGDDVFWAAIKGVRTGIIIGSMSTIIIIPLAVFFGVVAGYFGKWIDDLIQYIYTTLASIPSILLIIAFMLLTDDRTLFQLCLIMGITSWTGLCRLIRAETLKLREQEYVQAARAFGVSPWKILYRHIIPNVSHLVIISMVLRFSGLVLAEAVLAYIGVGLDPTQGSWGNMINAARLELGRDPVVYWNLTAAFFFMLGLVLSTNLFGDALRDALDPRLRTE